MYTEHPATDADYRYCYNLCKSSMIQLFTQHWGGWKPSSFRSGFAPSRTTVIRIANRRAGWYSVRDEPDHSYLSDIYIAPRYRGRGIGSKVIRGIIDSSRHPIVRLTTFIDNPALSLYKRLGFTIDENEDGVLKMHYDKHTQQADSADLASCGR